MENDALGEAAVPARALYGVHTVRAMENFNIARRPPHTGLIKAYGTVKLACAVTNRSLNAWTGQDDKGGAIERACREMSLGQLTKHVIVDALQGGAGTSLNMNVNEVIANRALQILNEPLGSYSRVSPMNDINLHQSTNDTFPTAIKLAAIRLVQKLEERVVGLLEAFQEKEKQFAHVVKVARTQYQDAVLITLGREMGAYADALARDRWRLYKCEERLRVVNLGGTAVGTGLGAPREYIFRVTDMLRDITGIGFARAENLVDATQNADVFVEVSGMARTLASTLFKISSDLRLLSSGPDAGLGEIHLPPRQEGSSIMPAKMNPVIPEAAAQAAMLAMGRDAALTMACSMGSLELNPFLPLVAHCLLNNLDDLAGACDTLRRHCVQGMQADEARCRATTLGATAAATALIPVLGHEAAAAVALRAAAQGVSVREQVLQEGLLSEQEFDACMRPEAICRLGSPRVDIPAKEPAHE
jgi:aspartate ammonia-lyase